MLIFISILCYYKVAMAGANPALSYAKIFSTFMHTIPPEHFQNQGRVAIGKHFKWRRVAILRENMDTYQGFSNDLVKKVEKDWDIDFCRQRWIADRRHTGLIRITLTRPVSVKLINCPSRLEVLVLIMDSYYFFPSGTLDDWLSWWEGEVVVHFLF